ncbi:Pycsar system effector family protein [Paraburkholderia caribensis]|uniref:Pycsar system effector family protein n=1 Tax=Paraburkholderia caribensis TaxID=75105 RepID=UPI00209083C7|nr:Pycsar system effector family protein [Paraburkholderia caribensis]MCO4879026.1 DUF5706 domain-containing protein [Paraburkholderia caribensis]
MDEKERIETAQWVFERTLGWIAAAEVKVGVIVTIDIALLGGLAAAYSSATTKVLAGEIAALIAGIICIAGIACAAGAIIPRLGGPASSLLFFGRIAGLTQDEFHRKFVTSTDKQFLRDWTAQIHRNSEIATKKHSWVRRALWCSFVSTIPWVVAIGFFVQPDNSEPKPTPAASHASPGHIQHL